MKKVICSMLALALVACFGTVALAQDADGLADSCLWLDIRNDDVGGVQDIDAPADPFTNANETGVAACNGGGAGDAAILRISPTCANGNHLNASWPNFDGDANASTGSLYLYMDVFDDTSGTGDVISSIGLDFTLADPTGNNAPNQGTIASLAYAWIGDALTAFDNGTTNAGNDPGLLVAGSPPSWEGAKAVKVPVEAGPLYAVGAGLVPVGSYLIGQLSMTAGPRPAGFAAGWTANSRFELDLSPNNLLITRTFETGGDDEELVNLGYDNGSPCDCEDPPVSGNVDGAVSALPDAIGQVERQGDSNGTGSVTSTDVNVAPNGLIQSIQASTGGTHSQKQTYLHDGNNSGTITSTDINIGGGGSGFIQKLQGDIAC